MMIKKYINDAIHNNKGQLITLMGALLAVTVISIAALSAHLATIGTFVPAEHSETLLPEFINVKETFAFAVNRSVESISNNRSILEAFEYVKKRIFTIEAKHGLLFNATLNKIYYREPYLPIRYISVTLRLTDGHTSITKTMDIPLYKK